MFVYCAIWCVLEYILIIYNYLSIKDWGANMGGQRRPLSLPLWKKTFFSLWGGGAFLHVGTFLLFFCYLNFLHVLDTPPPPYKNFCPPLPPPSCSSVIGNVLLWNAIMALWSHNYPIVIELWEGGA